MAKGFSPFFERATGRKPYSFQERFAQSPALFDLLPVPTGGGKTVTICLGWLYRRLFAAEEVRKATPRRLVYCLPMRTLVEQTVTNARGWLANLGLQETVRVHTLLGGDVDDDWALRPEADAILVGTQDMLLSRALNRGYAQGRFRWPIDFGLLHNDCLWVFDEVQLMGSGLSTSAQLAGLHEKLGTFAPGCKVVWMSATLERDWLDTIDLRDRVGALADLELTEDELKAGELGRRMQAAKVLKRAAVVDATDAKYSKAVAEAVKAAHRPGRLTLVVLNTVDRARGVYEAVRKLRGLTAETVLLHSRFRPGERERLNRRLTAPIPPAGRIVVSTQVVEAGVDISARVLFTELAPWPSLVQRFGRCHRGGEFEEPGEVFWLNVPEGKAAAPYEPDELALARGHLERLAGKDVSPLALRRYQQENGLTLPFEHEHVLRRRDLLELFDTAPDLSGNDIDIARFVRGADKETDVSVFWRDFDAPAEIQKEAGPRREELCPVPVGQLRDFLKGDEARVAYRQDHLEDEWVKVRYEQLRPGMVLLLPCSAGGYDWDGEKEAGLGWCADPAKKPAAFPVAPHLGQGEEGVGADGWSQTPAQTLAGHTADVCDELEEILRALDLPPQMVAALRHAAQWHDIGKAHAVFQASIRKANETLSGEVLWAKSGRNRPLRHGRKHFRHELASALAMLALGQPFLSAYLVAAHHGRVRLGIRSLPGETPPNPPVLFALGIHEGDQLPPANLGGGVASEGVTVSLAPMLLGAGSWGEQALAWLREVGPFRLAYLEALLRAADMRASENPRTEVQLG